MKKYMDKDGYPTKYALRLIKKYGGMLGEKDDGNYNPKKLLEVLNECWNYYPPKVGRKYIYLDTAGWSGNEDIVRILMKSWFWFMNWESSKRGGHYRFRKPKF